MITIDKGCNVIAKTKLLDMDDCDFLRLDIKQIVSSTKMREDHIFF